MPQVNSILIDFWKILTYIPKLMASPAELVTPSSCVLADGAWGHRLSHARARARVLAGALEPGVSRARGAGCEELRRLRSAGHSDEHLRRQHLHSCATRPGRPPRGGQPSRRGDLAGGGG